MAVESNRVFAITKQFKGVTDPDDLSLRMERAIEDLQDLIQGLNGLAADQLNALFASVASLQTQVDSKQDTLVPAWRGYVETATTPNTTDFPENTFGLHYDNVGLVYRFCFSKGGAVRKVTLT